MQSQQTFDEYWLAYLKDHSQPATRLLHYIGLFVCPLTGIACLVFSIWRAFFVIATISYVIAMFTHPLQEKNSNEEFASRPWWSVVSFFRMFGLELTGRLHRQVARLESNPH